jgi:transcriptional regulator with XRE-family HTH domain
MSDADRILTEFMQAWEAGRRPEPDAFIDRAPRDQRHGLSKDIQTYLMIAPEPEYDEESWAALAASPAAARALEIPLGEPEPWPSLLPRLRARLGLGWSDVARRLEVSRPEKAERYLEAMERGEHDPRRVTRRALERLGQIFAVPADALAWMGPAGPAPAGAVLRSSVPSVPADVDALAYLAELATTDADEWDDSDALFLGGRES